MQRGGPHGENGDVKSFGGQKKLKLFNRDLDRPLMEKWNVTTNQKDAKGGWGGKEDGEEGRKWRSGRGMTMTQDCVWRERDENEAHHQQLHVAGS
jgi:hypothetical protein